MPDISTRYVYAALLATFGFAGTARAALPDPGDFSVTYYVTDESGEFVRPMVERDFRYFSNRARCECGQRVGIEVKAKANAMLDTASRIQAYIGTQCPTAETSLAGQFLRCGVLAQLLGAEYIKGISGAFHPAFLPFGVDPAAPTRDVGAPETILGEGCGDVQGEAGLWLCSPNENAIAGCQAQDFFYGPDNALSKLSDIPTLAYDFSPPLMKVTGLTAEPGSGGVELHWEVPGAGDIAGFRVLCEEADSGASLGLDKATPDLLDLPSGTHYFTAGNLCGAEPFSTVKIAGQGVEDPGVCGNGVVEAGEACDDGDDNGPAGLCDAGCGLRVSAGLHALDWDHVCSDHIPFSSESVAIAGLENGKTYNFVLVAYDAFGNPRVHDKVVTATPDEALPAVGGDEGAAEGCACAAGQGGPGLWAMSLVGLLGLARRRRR
ncbi:MYXO-CTERM sorting domain-containing protein [Nannocystis bainbridge]|uniref:MYXO-CTERM sorting domain-containing protein n=1 Tax=Nannocystis bainbridge TaxID=2995303 RepID=A0ABT5DVN0_9BACT|nr:MYXO-CTERM sorting domain-containing protein [Nannocystis bainbridge]MDC0717129.1 MYXO-CTERM sorting domain-containing protein [Nannocystis bainbridge]